MFGWGNAYFRNSFFSLEGEGVFHSSPPTPTPYPSPRPATGDRKGNSENIFEILKKGGLELRILTGIKTSRVEKEKEK